MMQSLATSLRVLSTFTEVDADLGVVEVAGRCGLTKSQTSKVMAALRRDGFLDQDAKTRRFRVGLRAYVVGSRFLSQNALCREATPIMRFLVDRSGHSTRLSVVDRDRVIYLMAIEGPLLLDTPWRAGTVLPWHATSAGRVLLAAQEDAEADAILARHGVARVTPLTVTDPDRLRRLRDEVRSRGYSAVRSESTPGLGAISVPVLGTSQAVVASLSLTFPDHSVPESDEPRLVAALHEAARLLSMRIGAVVYSPLLHPSASSGGAAQPSAAAPARRRKGAAA